MVIEVAVPAAARAVIGDPPGQPVPLQAPDRVFGVQDQPGQPVPPQGLVGVLVAGQPGAARRVADLGVDGPPAGGQVGDLLPAAGAGPGQRRVAAGVAAGQGAGRALGGAEQRPRPGAGADPVLAADHGRDVGAGPGVAGGRDGAPPVAGRPGGGGQPDQVRVGHLVPGEGAGIGGQFGQRAFHARQPKPAAARAAVPVSQR